MEYRRGRFKLVEIVRSRIQHQVSECSPSSYHRRRYKGPRLCCKLVAREWFCQHWPVRLQEYENGYILLEDYMDQGGSCSLWVTVNQGRSCSLWVTVNQGRSCSLWVTVNQGRSCLLWISVKERPRERIDITARPPPRKCN